MQKLKKFIKGKPPQKKRKNSPFKKRPNRALQLS